MTRWTLVILTSVLLLGCAATESHPTHEWPPQHAYDWPALCPAGHEQLRHVPIIYGYTAALTPEARRLEAAGEVINGGCIFLDGYSPTAVAICSACEFRYDPLQQKWDRFSRDPQSFCEPLSPLITGFPLPPVPQERPPHYGRTVVGNVIRREMVGYWTSESAQEVKQRVENHLDSLLGAVPDPFLTRADDGERTTYVASLPDGNIEVEVLRQWDHARVLAMIKFEPRP